MLILSEIKFNKNCKNITQNGFTLVELMVVIFLIGLASAAVVMALPNDDGRARQHAEKLAMHIAATRNMAILQARPTLVSFSISGYAFEQRRDGAWQAFEEKQFQSVNLPSTLKISSTSKLPARIMFDATGMPNAPARISINANDGPAHHVNITASGDVKGGQN
ncbi:type II secretion system protein GspH [Sphingorhabdus lutea]|uniref:Type II secretion system protein H n=1 Tax=Sphingorhabdus lutea TaxID=1913578 RepID=A0A1L3JA20_9SPHN|nr:GspH/FimT family pseudopilin [Sphingorhabdus lutea]APG61980.1 type II secretion system protein GspH [Sphingorhabdus lutea]